MVTTRIAEQNWPRYFDANAPLFRGRPSSIEVIAPDLGAQRVADGVVLLGISYDPRERQLDVLLEVLDHRIEKPQELHVARAPDGVVTIETIDGDGRKTILRIGTHAVPHR
ncbi:DUF5335 family protein [Azospirillum agricola]|uniref:DUF5335 family protein n=1 Tax=Azospirillum agricola TaxID=1720247 RepID=UPI000A0F2898|nr:DUF5335 family protein [Azospirillum agricola]SMH46070.1 hypothetical protein SAMN02982994_2336 [Azospirillum lipoferum]